MDSSSSLSTACFQCGDPEAPFACSRSRAFRFCSARCQRAAGPTYREFVGPGSRACSSSRSAVATPDLANHAAGDWVRVVNADAFAGMDTAVLPAADISFVKSECCRLGCGGFVVFRGAAYLRRQSPAELHRKAQHTPGCTIWLPAWKLAESAVREHGLTGLHLPPSFPEVMFPGAGPVDKCSCLTEADMRQRLAQSRPVVLRDAQRSWAAREKWTFEWLADRFGDEEMPCSDLAPYFKWCDKQCIQTVLAPMREVVRYVLGHPNGMRIMQKAESQVFYANGWAPFSKHPELLADVSDRLYCVPDTVPRDGPAAEFNYSLTKVFFGPAGTVSRLHHDTYATHVWLSQIRGRKQFIVFPPEDSDNLHAVEDDEVDGKTSLFDPSAPDYHKFPRARKATAFSVVVEEGETVVLPSRWWHWAASSVVQASATP